MNTFTVHAVGNLTRDPEQLIRGNKPFTRFCLAGNDFAGKNGDGPPRELVVSMWFTAFGPLGEVIARNSRKGDQLIVQARVTSYFDRRTDRLEHQFIVTGFRFGAPGRAKREELEAAEADAEVPAAAAEAEALDNAPQT
jgi:single-stranded DNA-binding protein